MLYDELHSALYHNFGQTSENWRGHGRRIYRDGSPGAPRRRPRAAAAKKHLETDSDGHGNVRVQGRTANRPWTCGDMKTDMCIDMSKDTCMGM